MPQIIEFQGEEHEFPDNFTDEQIAKALKSVTQQVQPQANEAAQPVQQESGIMSATKEAGRQIARTVKDLGVGVTTLGGLADLPNVAINSVLGGVGSDYRLDMPSQVLNRGFDEATGGLTAPRDNLERYVDTAAQSIAGGGPINLMSKAAPVLKALLPTTGSNLAGAGTASLAADAASNIKTGNPIADAVIPMAAAIGGGGVPSVASGIGGATKTAAKTAKAGFGIATGSIKPEQFVEDIANKLSNNKSPFSYAERKVVNTLKQAGIKEDRIVNYLEVLAGNKNNLTLPEMVNVIEKSGVSGKMTKTQVQALVDLQKNIMQKPGRGQDILTKAYLKRAADIYPHDFDKFIEGVTKNPSLQASGEGAIDVAKGLYDIAVKTRKEAADIVYSEANLQPVNLQKLLPKIKDPVIIKATKKVASDPYYKSIAEQNGFTTESIGFWDLVKRSIDDDIEGFKGSALMPADKTRMASASSAKAKLVSAIDEQNGIYSKSRKVFSDLSQPINRLDKTLVSTIANSGKDEATRAVNGRNIANKVFSDSPERIIEAKKYFKLNNAGKQWDDLLGSQLNDEWEKSGSNFAKFSQKLDNDKTYNKLIAGMDGNQRVVFRHLIRNFNMGKRVGRGYSSDTAKNLLTNKANEADIASDIIDFSQGGAPSLRKKAIDAVDNKLFESRNFEIARIFTGETAKELATKLKGHSVGSVESKRIITEYIQNSIGDAARTAERNAIYGGAASIKPNGDSQYIH